MSEGAYEKPPVVVIALHDSLSICKGRVYQFREYTDANYYRWGDSPPREPLGTLEGIGGVAPCCVHYPKKFTQPVEPPAYLEWI